MKYIKFVYDHFLEALASIAFIGLIFLTFSQVLSRYVLKAPITFSEELGRFLFIWVSFLGAAIVMKHDNHIRLDLLHRIPPTCKCILDILVFLTIFLFSALVFVQSIKLVSMTGRQIAPVSRIPMSYIYLTIPISTFFMCLYSIQHTISRLRLLVKK